MSLPAAVRVREVGPRDGFQNEPEVIATDDKITLVDLLGATGVQRLEVTSFVRADVIPQLADAGEVLQRMSVPDDVDVTVLIPNERGFDNALAHRDRFREINCFLSATESHNKANVNRSVEESLAGLERVIGRAVGEGLRAEAVISVAFGCPYEGHVAPERVFAIAQRLVAAGASESGVRATTRGGQPRPGGAVFPQARGPLLADGQLAAAFPNTRVQVGAFFRQARATLLDDVELTAHFHNTRGQGLANVYAALEAGCASFESSFGELGGCPVPAGATGNIATEDLVSMLHEMGIATGIDLERLLDAARAARDVLGRPLGSHTLIAGAIDWQTP